VTSLVPPNELPQTCPLCSSSRLQARASSRDTLSIFRCRDCDVDFGVYRDNDRATAQAADHFRNLDLEKYERSVRATRESSYDKLLAHVAPITPQGNWLDVGCSYGWLLSRLKRSGYHGFGVEPSEQAARDATAQGLAVTCGLFPQESGPQPHYSVISFMDVLEHLIDPPATLQAARKLLEPSGVLVLQVPDRACSLYQIAESLCRYSGGRLDFALRRLWLADIDFPHRFYFSLRPLTELMHRADFEVLDWYRSPIGSPRQALDRVGYLDGRPSWGQRCVALAVAGIGIVDAIAAHGGLLTLIARPRKATV